MAFTKKQWEEWKKSNPDKWKERSEKIAAAHKGRSIRDTHKAAISASMKGRTLSDAHRKKISQAMKKVKSSKLNKNTINHNSFDKIRVTAFVLLALIIFAFVFGFTNLGFFVAPPSNFELYNNISVGSDADIISEHVIFGGYKPENCDDGVLVYRGNGSAINFYSTSEVYVDSTCSEVDVHFENDIYKSSDEFDVYYVNPTPRHGSIFNNGNFQIRIKTNKVSTFALLELNDSTTILNSPMAGSMNEWSYSLSNLADGNYYIRVFAQDQDANLITTEQIMITVDSSAEAQEFYFTDVGDEKENYYVYYQIAPGQEIISDISQPTFEVESSKKQVRPPQFNIPEIIPDEVPAEPAVESILLSSDEPVYDTDIKQVFYDFDYPLQAETTYTAKFKGQSGNKRDLRFELNNTYYEFDFDSIYYRVDGNEIKSFKLNQDKGVSFNKNKLTYSNLGHGIKVEYEIGDNSLFENITIPQLNFLDVGSTGDVVIEGIIDIPVNQDILLYADGPAGNTTILYTDGTELDVSIADGVIVEEAEGYASGIMIEIQPEIAESRHKLENTKYTIIEPNGNTHGKEFKKLITEGDIDFVDENNKTLFFLPRPKIFDADGNIIFTKYELEKINGELKLRIIIPAEWLSTAQYPIVADPETVAYTYGASYTARLYTGHKNLWRDNRGKWFIFSVDGNAWPYRGVLTTDATGSWVTTTLCGNSSAVITGLGAGLTGCHQMSSYMEKHDNTYHVVIGAWDGSDYQMVHSQCVLENSSSHTLTNCWTATNGTVGYDAVSASGYSANLPDMTIDRDGNMYILYRIESRAPATANKYDLEVRKYNESSGWETAKMLFNYTSGTDGGATWNTIDSSAEGNVHIVYIDSKNTGVTDNTCYHTVSRNGGATWTGQAGGSNDTLTTTCLGPSMSITSDDKIILVTQEGSNDIYRRIWNETGTSVPGRTLLTSTYSNPPRVGSAANGGAVIFFSERTGTYRQMISKLTKESLTPATPSVYASPSPARAGDFCSVERKGTIFSTTNNIGLARYTAVSNNSLFHITETVYDSGSSAVYGDQKYQVLPLTGTDIQAVQSSDYSDNHAILRDSEGYYYVLMLSDWNTTYATDGGVLYMSRSLTTDVDTNGIIYFDNPKPIIGTNLSDATIQIVLTPPMFITDFSAWMDPDTDHLHIAFAGFKNYTTAAPANGPYNNIYYAELENLVNYSTLSSWNSYYFFGTYYYVTIAGPPGGIPITTVSYNYDPAIIGDYDGNVYIAYQNDTRGSTDENQTLHVRKRAAGAGLDGWGTATDIETDYGWTKDVSLDVDSKNRIYVAYSHKLQTGLSNYARLRRSSDSAATWRNLSGAVGYEAPISRGALTSFINGPDVAVTPDDRVFLVANQRVALSVYDLNTITWVNSSETSWATNINLADTVYHYYPSIGAGSAGEVIFLWSRKAGGYHNDTSWRGNSYSAPGTWSSAVAVYDHESDTYSGGPSVLSEYRSRQDSDIFGYMATKGSSYGGWYFGILDTGNFTTTDRCLNLATPGTYTLTENLTGKQYNNDYCIRILVDNITLDCDNYAIDGSGTSGTYGIFMTGKSNVVIKDCIVEDYDWDFVSMGTSTNNTVQNLTTNGTNVNFTYGGNVFVRGAVSPGTDAPGQMNISHFLNITNNTTAWMYLNVSYDASDIPVDISNNTTIKIWKNSSGTWSDSIGTPNAIDETNKRVYANITNFSSIFAPMGELSCVDTDGDGFGTGDTAGCTYSEVDCDDSDDEIHPLPNGTSYTLNHSVTVCTETYVNTHVTINTDDVILNCNNSVLDGNDDTGTGILLSGTINNSEVWNCTIFDYFDGIKIYSQVTYPTFRNNNLSFNGNDGIYLTTAEHSLIINNTVNSNSQNGINLAECQNDTIINNTANSNTQAGIILSAQSNFSVVENNTANSNSYGIYLTQCLYSNVTDNTANSNSIAGIYLSSASIEARITNNIANSNDYWGIGIESDDNIITDNIATLNTDIGIYLSGADNNTITDNNASFNPNWDFLSETTSNDNTIVNLITDDTNSSFTYSGNLQLTSATSPATDPVGYSNISKYINVTNSGTAWMLLNVTYNQTYVETDLELDESSLIMYKHNGSWYDASAFANVYGVDTTNDYVYANISDFSIFSLMGPSISCHITTELTLSENLICTSGFNITDTGILHTAGFNVTVTGGNTNITGDLDFVGGYGNFTNTVTTYSGSNWTSSSSAVINVTNYTHSAGTMNMGNADFHVYGTWDTAGGLDAQTSTTYMYTGAVIQSDASGQNTGAYHLIVPAGEVVNKTGSGTYFSIDGILEINGTVQYVSGDRRFAIWGLGTGEMIMGPSADVSTMDLASVLTNNITESTWGRLSITDGATTTLLGDLTLTRDASLQVYHWGTSFSTFNLNGYTVNMTGSNDVFYAGSGSSQGRVLLNGGTITGAAVVDVYTDGSYIVDSGSGKIDTTDIEIRRGYINASSTTNITATGNVTINDTFRGSSSTDLTFGWLDVTANGNLSCTDCVIEIDSEDSGTGYALLTAGYTTGNVSLNFTHNGVTEVDLYSNAGGNFKNIYVDNSGITAEFNSATITGSFVTVNGIARPNVAADTLTIGDDLNISSGTTFGLSTWTGDLTIGDDMLGTGTYSRGDQEVTFNGSTWSSIRNSFDFYNITVAGPGVDHLPSVTVSVRNALNINSGKYWYMHGDTGTSTLVLGNGSQRGHIYNSGYFLGHKTSGSGNSVIKAANGNWYGYLEGTGTYDWDYGTTNGEVHWMYIEHRGTGPGSQESGGGGVTIQFEGHNMFRQNWTLSSGDTMDFDANGIYSFKNLTFDGTVQNEPQIFAYATLSDVYYDNITARLLRIRGGYGNQLNYVGLMNVTVTDVYWDSSTTTDLVPYDASSILNVVGGVNISESGTYFGADSSGNMGDGNSASGWNADMNWGWLKAWDGTNVTLSSGNTTITSSTSLISFDLVGSGTTCDANSGRVIIQDNVASYIEPRSCLYDLEIDVSGNNDVNFGRRTSSNTINNDLTITDVRYFRGYNAADSIVVTGDTVINDGWMGSTSYTGDVTLNTLTVNSGGTFNKYAATTGTNIFNGAVTIANGGSFDAVGSEDSVWFNDDVSVSGEMLIEDSTVHMNTTTPCTPFFYALTTSDLTITNSTFTNNGTSSDTYAMGWYSGSSGSLNVQNSTFEYYGDNRVYNSTYSNCEYYGGDNSKRGLPIRTGNVTVYNNTFYTSNGRELSFVSGAAGVSNFTYNNITNSIYGIIVQSDNWNINYNDIASNTFIGFFLYSSADNNIISYNNISGGIGTDDDVVRIYQADNNTFSYNNVIARGTGAIGILLYNGTGGADVYNVIEYNTISAIGDECIQLQDSTNNNNISHNDVSNCSHTGAIIATSTTHDNLIWDNYFNATGTIATDDGTNNYWNITKSPGPNIIGGANISGNYWPDYTGADTDGDGIGDTGLPYAIGGTGSANDYGPLTNESTICHIDEPVTLSINLVCTEGMNITSSGSLDANGNNVNVTGGDVVNEGTFTAGSGTHNFTGSLISTGIIYSDSSTIECGTNWNTTLGTFYRNTSTIKMYGTGTFSPQGGWGAQTPYTVHVAYPGQVTTLGNSFYMYNDLKLEGGNLSMGSSTILSYDYYVGAKNYIYGDANISATTGMIRLRVGDSNSEWNNSVYIPALRFERINTGNNTINITDDINAGDVYFNGDNATRYLIVNLKGGSINATNIHVGTGAATGYVHMTEETAGTINASNDLTLYDNSSTLELSSTVMNIDERVTLESNTLLDGGTADHTFGAIVLESGSTYNATTGTTTITGFSSYDTINFSTGSTFNHNNGKIYVNSNSLSYAHVYTGNKTFYDFDYSDTSGSAYLQLRDDKLFNVTNDLTIINGNFTDYSTTDPTMHVGGDVVIQNGAILWTSAMNNYHEFGSLNISSGGTYEATSGTTNITNGDMTGSGTFNHNEGNVEFSDATSAQLEGGFTFYNLTTNTPTLQPLGLSNDEVTIENYLNINSGKMLVWGRSNSNNYTITLGNSSYVGRINNLGTLRGTGTGNLIIQGVGSSYYGELEGTGDYDWNNKPNGEIHWKYLRHQGTHANAQQSGGGGVDIVLDEGIYFDQNFTISSGDTFDMGGHRIYTYKNVSNEGSMFGGGTFKPAATADHYYNNINVSSLQIESTGLSGFDGNNYFSEIKWNGASDGEVVPWDSFSVINVTGLINATDTSIYFGADSSGNMGDGNAVSGWNADMSWGSVYSRAAGFTLSSGNTTITSVYDSSNNSFNFAGSYLDPNSGTLKFTRSGNQRSYADNPGYNYYNLVVDGDASTVVKLVGESGGEVVDNDLTVETGTIRGKTDVVPITVVGEVLINNRGTFGHNTWSDTATFGSLNVTSGGTYEATSGHTVLTSYNSNNYIIDLDGTFNDNSGVVNITTSSGGKFMDLESTGNLYDLILDATNTNSYYLVGSGTTIDNDLNVTSGILRPSGSNPALPVTVTGDVTVGSSGTLGYNGMSGIHSFGSLSILSGGFYNATSNYTNIGNYMSINGTYVYNSGIINISGTNTKFANASNIRLEKVDSPPVDPSNYENISYYVNVTNLTASGGFDGGYFNITYDNSDPTDETRLEMWKYNGTSWTQDGISEEGVNTTGDYVYSNITSFSIFAPLELGSIAPNITQIIVDDYDSVDTRINNITLNGGSTRIVMCNGTATDTNGFADISVVNATFYDTAVGSSGSDDNNTHYTNTSCTLQNGAGNSLDFNCTFGVYYYANSTDWQCNATVYDNGDLTDSDTDDNHIDELISVDSSDLFEYFGSIDPNTVSAEEIFEIINEGNVRLDLSLNGTNFDCGIDVGLLKYNCTTASQNYDTAMANLTTTSSSSNCNSFDLVKTTTATNSTDDIYWKLLNPLGTIGGQTCSATIRIAGTKG